MPRFILTLFALLALTGCFEENAMHNDDKPIIVTSFTIIADMAQNVGGEAVNVVSITKPGAEIHDYQPTPKDIARTKNADLILSNGLNLERWFNRFLNDINDDIPHVILTEGIPPLSIYEGPYDGKPNPHAWMSLKNAVTYIDNIEKALTSIAPESKEIFAKNAKAYKSKIEALSTQIKDATKDIPKSQRTLVTSEGAFTYLAHDLGFKELYLWPINADQQGTPAQVRKVIDTVRAQNIPVVFSESTISPRPAKQVADETGAYYGGVLYVDSLSTKNGPVPTYIDLLRVTTQTIANGFQYATKETQNHE